jgi:hypothetical protein
MDLSELRSILNAHGFLRVERPPAPWSPAAETEPFIRLLGEMIAAALVRNGGLLSEVTLNVANVTVEPATGSAVPAGDFVAISIGSSGRWLPETTWPADPAAGPLVNADLDTAAHRAGAAYGYVRSLGDDNGSVTVFFRRTAG